MADFNKAIGKTLAHEGGAKFTDDPTDRGGATKYGISQRAYPNVDIRNLTEQQARDIYKRDYWDRIRADEMTSQAIAENIFDTAVNMGVRTASRLAQVALDIEPADGIIGSQSLKTINAADESSFIANYTIAKIARYTYICNRNKSQKKYLLGWINRALGGVA
ncbi:Lysozyme (N-acetylmuramidase) family [hydrothermal vent metagenome]|uniref:Lysozyme (N-acetylmuramidase) family n=1 Tax=hydrothermal vent metagenome TaxID=652676 RepID=A0A3B1BAY6_9ZZZZ